MTDTLLPEVFVFEDKAFSIERLTEADLPALLVIERRSHPYPWSQQNFSSSLGAYTCVGLKLASEWVGYAVLAFAAGEGELLLFVLDKPWQGRGLATVFLQRLLQWSAPQAQAVFLEVRASNHRAIALYETVGFNQVGERPNYYPASSGRSEHALIYAYEH